MTNVQQSTIFEINDSTANPAPLGLVGFGMTTVLLKGLRLTTFCHTNRCC
ncbi:hypothetical protein GMSM_02970 [Geomonas sp. Red276]